MIKIITQTGNWSDPTTWYDGEIPTVNDDIIWEAGKITVDTSDAICNSIDLSNYPGYFNFVNGAVLTVRGQIYLAPSSSLILANPVNKFNFQSSVNVWYDGKRSVAIFNNGISIYIIKYV